MAEITMPRCACCSRPIAPDDIGTVSFGCPVCGILPIIRCSKCRQLGNTYKCPNCGFVGP